ncbi:MAG TPA: glycosyltransferase family 2 protein [Opitutales bacterium]|nr:glycosyltransferase family 2 protein [Opitutales bacterium]
MSPILSICIPSKGKSLWLKYLLEQLLPEAQSLAGAVEIVVSDNASSDQTPQILANLQAQYPTILRYERQPSTLGMFDNFQKALQLAQGTYAWVLGNDDYLRVGTLKKIITVLKSNTNIDYLHINCSFFSPGPTPEKTPELQAAIQNPISQCNEYALDSVREVVDRDPSCFTPIYCSIVRRKYWVDCCKEAIGLETFSSTAAVVPHAVHLVKHLLDKPAYYLGGDFILASRAVTWPEHMAIYVFEYLPDIFHRLEEQGINRKIIDNHRRTLLKSNQYLLSQLLRAHDKRFHLIPFFRDNAHLFIFWSVLAKALLWNAKIKLRTDRWLTPALRTCMPRKIYHRLKSLVLG